MAKAKKKKKDVAQYKHPTPALIKEVKLFFDDKPSISMLRIMGKKILKQIKYPTKDNENWKYTDISEIIANDFEVNTTQNINKLKEEPNEYFINLGFELGRLIINSINLPKGVSITPLALELYNEENKKYIYSTYNIKEHPFACLNGNYLEQGLCVVVDKNIEVQQPILINYNQSNCDNLQIHIHNLIVLEENSKLNFVENFHTNDNGIYLNNIVNEISLRPNSILNHYKVQKESSKGYHIALNAIKSSRNSTYNQYYLSDGGKISRNENLVNLNHENSSANIYSTYMSHTNSLTDITTNINHLSPSTHSKQYAKGILEENSVANFLGKIHISKDSIKTNANQLHKGLYIGDTGKLNCKPELEIYADDVKCSHGASCGEIDNEQLFYLISRGIDAKKAKKMLTDAHLNEIIDLIKDPEIKSIFQF